LPMAITAVAPTTPTTTSTAASSSTTSTSNTSLDRQAFLKLLVAQLRYQDPSKPMDASQMISQSAQLSVVDKLDEISKTLSGSAVSDQLMLAGSLIGKTISFKSSEGGTASAAVTSARFEGGVMILSAGEWDVPLAAVTAVASTSAAATDRPAATTPAAATAPVTTTPATTTPATTTPAATTTPDASTTDPVAPISTGADIDPNATAASIPIVAEPATPVVATVPNAPSEALPDETAPPVQAPQPDQTSTQENLQ
jgi:flagellar basal-body rod modification protein FlgD